MKNLLIFILMSIGVHSMQAQNVETIEIDSEALNQTREISIYKPSRYDISANQYYDVYYVFDAQLSAFPKYVSSLLELLNGDGHKGAIVVGISATYTEKPLYARNHDFLPSDMDVTGKGSFGNQDNFLAYVKNEVISYVESNYRVRRHRTAIGHSLGGSFVIHTLLNEPTLFDNIISISPNLSYKNERLANGLEQFDFDQLKGTRFIYVSHGEENDEQKWPGWKSANERAYKVLTSISNETGNHVVVEQNQNEDHVSNFVTSLNSALRTYISTIMPLQHGELSDETYKVTITAKVPDQNDELYITGNQDNLGNWNPGLIKMNKTSAFERSLTLELKDIAELRFTRGSWEKDAWVKALDGFSNFNCIIRPEDGQTYAFEVKTYSDRMAN